MGVAESKRSPVRSTTPRSDGGAIARRGTTVGRDGASHQQWVCPQWVCPQCERRTRPVRTSEDRARMTRSDVQVGVFVLGAVPMPDAGAGDPQPTDRRASNEQVWHTTERLVDLGVAGDRLGYDYYFLTEHHFQHEGYEVIPNAILDRDGGGRADRAHQDRGAGARASRSGTRSASPRTSPRCTTSPVAGRSSSIGRGTVPRGGRSPLGSIIGIDRRSRCARAEQDDRLNREMFDEAVTDRRPGAHARSGSRSTATTTTCHRRGSRTAAAWSSSSP